MPEQEEGEVIDQEAARAAITFLFLFTLFTLYLAFQNCMNDPLCHLV